MPQAQVTGAGRITERARSLAADAGVLLSEVVWNDGRGARAGDEDCWLTMTVGDRTIDARLTAEQVRRFSGTEPGGIDDLLRRMLAVLAR